MMADMMLVRGSDLLMLHFQSLIPNLKAKMDNEGEKSQYHKARLLA